MLSLTPLSSAAARASSTESSATSWPSSSICRAETPSLSADSIAAAVSFLTTSNEYEFSEAESSENETL